MSCWSPFDHERWHARLCGSRVDLSQSFDPEQFTAALACFPQPDLPSGHDRDRVSPDAEGRELQPRLREGENRSRQDGDGKIGTHDRNGGTAGLRAVPRLRVHRLENRRSRAW